MSETDEQSGTTEDAAIAPDAGDNSDGGLLDEPLPPPSTARAAKEKVLAYFAELSGMRALSGIENKFNVAPRGHSDEVATLAMRTPAFWGVDFGFGVEAVENRGQIIAEAKRQWDAGAVVAFMYHTCVPTRDEYCEWDDVGGLHPQHLTESEWNQLFEPGTDINREWLRRLDLLADHFEELRDAGIAPLFRPFHEMNQCAFWWSCNTRENGTVRLWKLTYDYLTQDRGLDHIVWVWNVQDFVTLSDDAVTYSPGADYFDMASLDIYNTGYTGSNYEVMRNVAEGKPFGIGECQFLPSLDTLAGQPEWSFFMLWPDFIREQRNLDLYQSLFASERVVTLDEMPGWR